MELLLSYSEGVLAGYGHVWVDFGMGEFQEDV